MKFFQFRYPCDRGQLLSWALFGIIFFSLQILYLVSQLNKDNFSSNKNVDEDLNVRKYELLYPHTKEELAKLFQRILRKNLRPPDSAYNFNVSISDGIALDRQIDDTRLKGCHAISYNLPPNVTVSVIVIFHNEALSTLLRTVHSIVSRSPIHLLKEVILVDDLSSNADTGPDLDTYVSALDRRVRILRNKKREGLVRSRLHGANNANGDILIWLDAHTECNTGWLEPLVYYLTISKVTIVQPHVDVISPTTIDFFAYPGEMYRGGFGWDLRYAWYKLPKYLSQSLVEETDPFPTPVLVGCAIAVRKDYFYATGQFDEGLNIWGGEHFDLSFRTWLCGGRILTIPCSRVGHMFKQFAYDFGDDRANVIRKNLMRVAEIWLDEYKWIFDSVSLSYGPAPKVTRNELRSRYKRKTLRSKLNCKPFRWFMEHIMPEIRVPSKDDVYFGEITNVRTSHCWVPLQDGYIGITNECFMHRILPENHFSLDVHNQMIHESQCIYMDETTLLLRKSKCLCSQELNDRGWLFQVVGNKGGQLLYKDSYNRLWCAKQVTNVIRSHYGQQMVQMDKCSSGDMYQTWTFTYKLTHL